jgi:hypothetical protein
MIKVKMDVMLVKEMGVLYLEHSSGKAELDALTLLRQKDFKFLMSSMSVSSRRCALLMTR